MKTKETRGITLITLAVTIVVLLILAGVGINTVVGDNGIIKKAKEAAEVTKKVSAEEEMNRLVLEYELAKKDETLEDFLQKKVIEGKIDEVIDNGDGTITIIKNVEKKNYKIIVKKQTSQIPSITISEKKVVDDSNGLGTGLGEASTINGKTLYITFKSSITGGTTTVEPTLPFEVTKNGTYTFTVTGIVNGKSYTKKVNVTVNQYKKPNLNNLNEMKIGDYVNYTYDTVEDYTVEYKYSGHGGQVTQTTGLKWKILDIDKKNGIVDIISEKPTSSYVYFASGLGYNNGPYLMNDICKKQYSNKALEAEARSIDLIDIEKHLTTAGISARNAYTSNTGIQYAHTYTYTANGSYFPLLYAKQKGAGINTTSVMQPDITKGNDPYEECKKITEVEPSTKNTYAQAESNGLTATQTYYYIPISNINYGEAATVISNSTGYWVAARCVSVDTDMARFGLRIVDNYMNYTVLYGSNTGKISTYSYLRPVVSLSSNVFTGAKKSNGAWNLQ